MSAWGHMYRKYDIVYNNIVYVYVYIFHVFFKIGRENADAKDANATDANTDDAENAMV
jgi:hypothetical protein